MLRKIVVSVKGELNRELRTLYTEEFVMYNYRSLSVVMEVKFSGLLYAGDKKWV